MRGLVLVTLLCGACGAFPGDDCTDDPAANHHAINPATGECWEFASSCDVPPDWTPCGDDVQCDAERACPPNAICVDGRCEPVTTGCTTDTDCAPTQHCVFTAGAAPPAEVPIAGTCVDNNACTDDTQCPDGQWCDTVAGDCDPSVPGCGAPAGICTRGTRPGGTCATNADCGALELCPLQWGGTTDVCEASCTDDFACAADEYCNNLEVCAQPNPGGGGGAPEPVPPACWGWCAQRAGVCDLTSDCGSGEICPAEYTDAEVSLCVAACTYPADCPAGTHCTVEDGICGTAQPKPTGGRTPRAALIPCQGWCE